jgi:hypothetical protein
MDHYKGDLHQLILPRSLYLHQSPSKLLSSQHEAQTGRALDPSDEVQCITLADKASLKWGTEQITQTVPITKS